MKEIYQVIDEMIELIRQSSKEKDDWDEIVSRWTPDETIEMRFCQPVETAIQKYLSNISEAEKRNIYCITNNDRTDSPDTDIKWIDFFLTESLFEEVMDRALGESKNS